MTSAKLTIARRLAIGLALLLAFGLGAIATRADETEESPVPVRSALAQTTDVKGAPKRELVLSRVVVSPGAELAPHHHLGTQVARVEAGTLTYTVRRGSVVVRSGESDLRPRVVRTIKAGQTGRIEAGRWIVEQPSDIHEAANRGSTSVRITIATLLAKGAPPATPVELP